MPAPITAMDESGKLISRNFQREEQAPYAMQFAHATTRPGNNRRVTGEDVTGSNLHRNSKILDPKKPKLAD